MRCKVRTLQQCAFGCMGASKDAHSQRWRRWYMGCRQSTNTSQSSRIDLTSRTRNTYRFLEHATTNTCSPFPNLLDLPAPGRGKTPAHLGFCRLGRITKFIHETLGLGIRVHRNRTWEGGGPLRRGGQRRVMFLEAFEEQLFMGGELLIPRRHPRQAIGKARASIMLHRQPLWDHLTGRCGNHGELRLTSIGSRIRCQRCLA